MFSVLQQYQPLLHLTVSHHLLLAVRCDCHILHQRSKDLFLCPVEIWCVESGWYVSVEEEKRISSMCHLNDLKKCFVLSIFTENQEIILFVR